MRVAAIITAGAVVIAGAVVTAGAAAGSRLQVVASRNYIYKVLKAAGLTPAGVIKELATKDNTLMHEGLKFAKIS